jgi:hypothetical protein
MGLFGGSASKGKQQSNSSTFVDPNQAPYLQDLYRQGAALAQAQQPGLNEVSGQLQQGLSQDGQNFNSQLMQAAGGQGQVQQGLQALGSSTNPYLDQQVQGLGGDISRFLQSSLGNIGQGFAGAGQYGSSRQGLAEGQAIEGAINEFGQQSANLRGGDLSRQAQALGQAGALQNQASATGLGALNDRFDLGMGAFNAQWNPLLAQSQIVGAPNNLMESSSSGGTTSGSVGFL